VDNSNRRSGTIELSYDGKVVEVAGDGIEYGGFYPKREMYTGPNGPQGYGEKAQVPFCSGKFRDSKSVKLSEFQNITNATILCRLANGKSFILEGACFASEGNMSSNDGTGDFRFEGMSGREI
jgi:hypothetical protein